MHLTLGTLNESQSVFYASAFFWLDGVPPPAPAQVTQTVGLPRAKFTQEKINDVSTQIH